MSPVADIPRRRFHVRLFAVVLTALGGTALATAPAALGGRQLLLNISPSEAMGVYARVAAPLRAGEIVAFIPPAAARIPGVPKTSTFLKSVAAAPGDHVCRRGDVVSVNGSTVAAARKYDSHKHLLPQWMGCRRLLDGEYFLLSNVHPNSFDSRYYGPISIHSIIGVYRLVEIKL